jgi:hypothetical protein
MRERWTQNSAATGCHNDVDAVVGVVGVGVSMRPQEVKPVMRCHPVHGPANGLRAQLWLAFSLVFAGSGPART